MTADRGGVVVDTDRLVRDQDESTERPGYRLIPHLVLLVPFDRCRSIVG
jgi:hypothetical protein